MATDINHTVLIGNLTKDVELKYSTSGGAIGNFSIAVNRGRKDANGQWIDDTSFFECKVFGKTAENLKPYLTKGQKVAIDGYLKQDRWKDQQGQNHSKVVVGINQIELLGGKKDNSSNTNGYDGGYNNSSYDNGYDGGYGYN